MDASSRRVMRDDSIGQSIRSLDLRNARGSALDARRRMRGERSLALGAMGGGGGGGGGGGATFLPPPPSRPSLPQASHVALTSSAWMRGGAAEAAALTNARGAAAYSLPPPVAPAAAFASAGSSSFSSSSSSSSSSSPTFPSSTSASSSAAARLAQAAASQAVQEVAQLQARATALDECLRRTVAAFAASLLQQQAATGESGAAGTLTRAPYYAVSFAAGPIGMILTTSADAGAGAGAGAGGGGGGGGGAVEVAELRDDAAGRPLLAKRAGVIEVGDEVLAVNGAALSRFGPPSLEDVAAEFRAAARPCTVLFRRRRLLA